MSELEILFPEPVVVKVGRQRVKVRPVSLRDFDKFGRAAGLVIAMATSQTVEQLYAYASRNGVLMEVLGRATNLSGWRIRRLPAAVAVSLMLQVIKVNAGFFEQALVDAEKALAGAESPSS